LKVHTIVTLPTAILSDIGNIINPPVFYNNGSLCKFCKDSPLLVTGIKKNVVSSAKGSKRYEVLFVAVGKTFIIEERHLKKLRGTKKKKA